MMQIHIVRIFTGEMPSSWSGHLTLRAYTPGCRIKRANMSIVVISTVLLPTSERSEDEYCQKLVMNTLQQSTAHWVVVSPTCVCQKPPRFRWSFFTVRVPHMWTIIRPAAVLRSGLGASELVSDIFVEGLGSVFSRWRFLTAGKLPARRQQGRNEVWREYA
jgi:hypothetical protein